MLDAPLFISYHDLFPLHLLKVKNGCICVFNISIMIPLMNIFDSFQFMATIAFFDAQIISSLANGSY